jgi:hypothetical protein
MGLLQQFHLIVKYKNNNSNKLEKMILIPLTITIIDLGTIFHMETSRRYFNYYKDKFVKTNVLASLATISRTNYTTKWISSMFAKDKY